MGRTSAGTRFETACPPAHSRQSDRRGIRLSVRTTAACRLFPSGEALFFTRANKIVAAAEQLAIPAMYFRREFALAGGLMSYGTNTDETFQTVCPSPQEATHPQCCCEGYPDGPGRASNKAGES